MARGIDFSSLWLRAVGSLLHSPMSGPELGRALRVSQPTISRLLNAHHRELLVTGKARSTRYHARRSIPDVGSIAPIYEIDEHGKSRRLALLHAVGTRGFHIESLQDDTDSSMHPDLPYLLDGMRPSGFLGRLVPRQHPELGFPQDIRLWSGDQVLRYLTRFGWNAVGNLIVGDPAFQRYLEHAADPPEEVPARGRAKRYVELAEHVLQGAPPGSSAAGEQPKFLTRVASHGDVLVKFSPPRRGPAARRVSDLLVAEHVAHGVVRRSGLEACHSSLIEAGEQLFLEIQRFDRTDKGRRGVVALEALDAEYADRAVRGDWASSLQELARIDKVNASWIESVRWLQTFGALIANTDMHPGNLSFITRGSRAVALAPVYDMLPARYAVQQGHVARAEHRVHLPHPSAAAVWDRACAAAERFWDEVASHPLVSKEFQQVARANHGVTERARALGSRLPR